MTTAKTLLTAAALVLSASTLDAQWFSRFNSQLPPWAESALTNAGFWSSYDFTSRISPEVGVADLDGDGLWDLAISIVDLGGRRRGIAIVHHIDQSVHIVGAGQPLGNGQDALPNAGGWGVGALVGDHSGIRVVGWHTSAWLVWNGRTYVWVQDSD